MGQLPIPFIQPVTIDTMLKNELNIGDGLNFVTSEYTFMVRNCILPQEL